MAHREAGYPMDLEATSYAYLERPNDALLHLVRDHVVSARVGLTTHVLDVGCGAGANAAALREAAPEVSVVGVEPNRGAAALAIHACHEVFEGTIADYLAQRGEQRFDLVLLSDVIEHLPDPVSLLKALAAAPGLRRAAFGISVPNYAVWYNRLRTLAGRFDYAWSGLYDRTHLRFFTRASLERLLAHCGLGIDAESCSPSLVQSAAPLVRRLYERDVARGRHLALGQSAAYRTYLGYVEPLEARLCRLWPTLLGFQLVVLARRR